MRPIIGALRIGHKLGQGYISRRVHEQVVGRLPECPYPPPFSPAKLGEGENRLSDRPPSSSAGGGIEGGRSPSSHDLPWQQVVRGPSRVGSKIGSCRGGFANPPLQITQRNPQDRQPTPKMTLTAWKEKARSGQRSALARGAAPAHQQGGGEGDQGGSSPDELKLADGIHCGFEAGGL